MKNISDSDQTAFNIEQKFCEDDICWEEVEIDFETYTNKGFLSNGKISCIF